MRLARAGAVALGVFASTTLALPIPGGAGPPPIVIADLAIKQQGAVEFHGDDVFNDTGANQKEGAVLLLGEAEMFRVMVENDGSLLGPITVTGFRSDDFFKVTYYKGRTKVSKLVKQGIYRTRALDPGDAAKLRVEVRCRADGDALLSGLITGTGTPIDHNSDTVKIDVQVGDPI